MRRIGDRVQVWSSSASAYIWVFVLRCHECPTRIYRSTLGALAADACETGWTPIETDDGADVFLCPRHAPTGDL